MLSEEECHKIGGKFKKGVCLLEPYLTFWERVEELERGLKDLPEIAVLGTQYFPLMLSRPICIEKELLKAASRANLGMLVDNEHIREEIGLLQKDMQYLKEDFKLLHERREKVEITV